MKSILQKLSRVLGPSLLGLLGFSSCNHFPLIPASEYGTPYGEFKVDINVTDESGKPLKNIAVTPILLHAPNFDIKREELTTIKTNENGKASQTYDNWWVDDVRMIFEDDNGVFAKDSADFKPVQTKPGDKHWYVGEKTVSGSMKLKKE